MAYRNIGTFVKQVNEKNKNGEFTEVLGVSIEKEFMPSVANTIGTDIKKYNVIRKNRFAFNPMHVGRDKKLPIAVYHDDEPALISPAYNMFEVIDENIDIKYLMLLFKTKLFDHLCWFYTDGSVRGGLSWEDFCGIKLNIPTKEEQIKIVNEYLYIVKRIELLKNLINKSEEFCLLLFRHFFKMENSKEKFGEYVSFMQGNQIDIENQFLNKENEMIRFLRIIDYTSSNNYEPPRYIYPPQNATFTNEDEVSIVRYGSLGTICRRKEGIIANNLFKVSPKKIINNNFIYYYLMQDDVQYLIKNSEGNSVMSAIKHSTIADLPMPEFNIINIDIFEKIASSFEKVIISYLKEIELLEKSKTIIISKLL